MEKKECDNTTNVNSLAADVPGLTEEERCQLEEVMRKAKEFDEEEENKTKKPLEGQLYKYTNVVKGWQYRWFVLTPEAGMFEYFMPDENRKHKPRGGLYLAGAVVLPSEDDCFSFTVASYEGEVYKLKAANLSERQYWISRLRTTIEEHSKPIIEGNFCVYKMQRSHSYSQKDFTTSSGDTMKFNLMHDKKSPLTKATSHSVGYLPDGSSSSDIESLAIIKSYIDKGAIIQRNLANAIEALPIEGDLTSSDKTLLIIKATSKAVIESLEDCYEFLRQRQLTSVQPKGLPPGATVEWVDKKTQGKE